MIKGELLGGPELVTKVRALEPKMRSALTQAVIRLTMRLLRNVKADKLTGQALKVRSGRLRRSINSKITGQNTTKVAGAVGTNLVYGRVHEYGFAGTVQVRESLRMQKTAFGRSITPREVTVPAHARHMNMPERSFLRSALQELAPEIQKELREAVSDAVK